MGTDKTVVWRKKEQLNWGDDPGSMWADPESNGLVLWHKLDNGQWAISACPSAAMLGVISAVPPWENEHRPRCIGVG